MESVEPPRAIGPYKLGRQLGEGAFSRVYLATDMRNGELVAVKAMEKARLAALGVVEHVSQEMTILQSLQHPHCIRLLAVLATRRHLFFAKELVAGGDLADYIALRGPLEPSCARRLMLQLAGALAYCHSLGIFHRDVKPENVLLTPEGDAQLTDFGLSFWAATGPGSGVEGACGTPLFAAPELRARGRVAGAPADVWSLGCLLFFMLVGRPPSVLGRGGGGPATGSPSVVEAVRRSLEQESASLGVDAHALLCSMLDSEPSRRATISQVVRSAWSRGGEAEGSGSYGEGGPETWRWIDQEASASSRLLCSPVAPCASSSVLDAQEGSLLLGHSQAASHLAQNSIIGVPDSPWILTQALPLPAPCLPSARLPASPTRRLNAFDLLASGMSEVQSLLAPGEWAARHHVRLASRSTSAPAALRALCAAAAERGAGVDVGASGAPGTAHCRLRVPPPRNGDARGDLQLTLEAWEILPGQVVLDAVKVCGSQMHFHAFLGQLARAVLPGLEDGDRAAEGGEAGQGELLSPGAASSGGVARRISPKSRTTAFDLMSRAINLQSLLASSDARPPSEQA